jgi:two-component system NtrC family sensor kinase
MIFLPAAVLIIVLGTGYSYFRTSIETSTVNRMKRIVEDHRHMIDTFLRERRADLEFILRSYSFEDLSNQAYLGQVFARLQETSQAFVDLGVFDGRGVHVAYQGPYELTGKVYSAADWFKEVTKRGHYVSDVFLGYRQVPHFVVALSRKDTGKTWVIRATIDTYVFNELVKKVRIGRTGEAYILNDKGLFQTERHSGGNLMEPDPDHLKYANSRGTTETFVENDKRGARYLYAITWLEGKDWLLVVRQKEADAFKALRSATYLIVLILIVSGSGIVGLASYLTHRIVMRMERMDREKDRLSQQLIHAARLAELGEMAAGFAHEINNPLQVMRSEQELIATILDDLEERDAINESGDLKELQDSLSQIKIQIERCAKITQAILKFGRQGEPEAENLDMRAFIPEVAAIVEKKAVVHGIALTHAISDDTPLIHADPGQLQQVFLNLFNNAIDAIISKHGATGGQLLIEGGPSTNGNVEVKVKDNGCGIDPDNLKRIFTPFYTTKPVGKGTGLGLSVCYGIIHNMGGVMEVSSEKGVGTRFSIRLPAVS